MKNKIKLWLQISILIALLSFQFNNCASKTEGGVFDGPTPGPETSGGPTDIFITSPGGISAKVGDFKMGTNDVLSFSGKCFPGLYPDNYIVMNWKFRGLNGNLKTNTSSTCANSNENSCFEAKTRCQHGRYQFSLPLEEAEIYLNNTYLNTQATQRDIDVNFQMVLIDQNGQSIIDNKYSTSITGSLIFIPSAFPQ